MAAETIINLKKPGFPVDSSTGDRDSLRIEYVGLKADLESARPSYGDDWGDYPGDVVMTEIQPSENPLIATLVVEVSSPPSLEDSTTGEAKEVTYEIEWVAVSRGLREHPQFRRGGGGANELSKQDLIDLEFWQNELDPDLKKDFKYNPRPPDETPDETELTENAKLFASGLLEKIEEYEDFAPVLRKTVTLVGGPSGTTQAGQKDEPAAFPGKPTGYEWLKTADRSVNSGGRKRWQRVEEWTGAKKVLLDKDEIFWETAT
jgi:hypothetical protein